MEQKVWAVIQECEDYFYGWYVTELYTTEQLARDRKEFLASINLGNSYDVQEWTLQTELPLITSEEQKIIDRRAAYNQIVRWANNNEEK